MPVTPVTEGVETVLSQLAPYDAKLRPPDLQDQLVQRRVLSQQTIERTDIVVLTAGAGYGKTTLLAQSVRSQLPWAWLTLHREDNDPATLVAYLLRALQTAWELPPSQLEHFSDPGASEASVLLPRLARLLESIPGPGVLVLDEIDAIEETRCLRVLETVLERAPEGVHILLSGRTLPPLGLDRLTKRSILELDEDDLVFTYDESLDLVASAQLQVDPRRVRQIHSAAEGWPTGIYLMALASQHSGLPPRSALSVEDYVVGGLDPDFRELLFAAGHAMDAAGIGWTILSGFRDDFRQDLVSGLKARVNNSFHGGSEATGGYRHGCAADLASIDRLSDNKVWNWVDQKGREFDLFRPLRVADPAHTLPTAGWHELAAALRNQRLGISAESDPTPLGEVVTLEQYLCVRSFPPDSLSTGAHVAETARHGAASWKPSQVLRHEANSHGNGAPQKSAGIGEQQAQPTRATSKAPRGDKPQGDAAAQKH